MPSLGEKDSRPTLYMSPIPGTPTSSAVNFWIGSTMSTVVERERRRSLVIRPILERQQLASADAIASHHMSILDLEWVKRRHTST